jgi:hypothetical protein
MTTIYGPSGDAVVLILEGLAAAMLGPLVCVQLGWATLPLGLVDAFWLRHDLLPRRSA